MGHQKRGILGHFEPTLWAGLIQADEVNVCFFTVVQSVVIAFSTIYIRGNLCSSAIAMSSDSDSIFSGEETDSSISDSESDSSTDYSDDEGDIEPVEPLDVYFWEGPWTHIYFSIIYANITGNSLVIVLSSNQSRK